MRKTVNLVLATIIFIKKVTSFKLEIFSDNSISKSLGYPLDDKSVKVLTDSLLTKEYMDLYKEMLQLSEDKEPYSHVKSRNALMPKDDNNKRREHRRRRNGHTLEMISHRRSRQQASRRERLARQSQNGKTGNTGKTRHGHRMYRVAYKHAKKRE